MIALILLVTMLTTGAAARLTRLVTDDKITQPTRDDLLHYLTYDHHQRAALNQHQADVHTALERGDMPPMTPALPPAENPRRAQLGAWLAWLVTCRWCAGLWTSLLVALTARAALTAPFPPVWNGLPWHPLDLLIVPAWTLATAYAVGWLADKED